ncbi:hypothetical protein KCH_66770 [Kitasatospora cheerisanensis KCTC 2395]|uniref:Uncharacterized protein n=1 Tax=Kitasatospora cheerisanensis KCTC 2395 TaxID=1348663 RepID=A0A066YUF8_9ACTN|nr:hypothetical protein KCH_66770 [Kitasatospora cheerisanensis KCTC 2395]
MPSLRADAVRRRARRTVVIGITAAASAQRGEGPVGRGDGT